MDENIIATDSANAFGDTRDSSENDTENSVAKSKLIKRDNTTEKDASNSSIIDQDQIANGTISNGVNSSNLHKQEESAPIDSDIESNTKDDISVNESNIQKKLESVTLQDNNGSFKSFEVNEDNLHGLAIPTEDDPKPEFDADNSSGENQNHLHREKQTDDDSNNNQQAHDHKRESDDETPADIETNEIVSQNTYENEAPDDSTDSPSNLVSNPNKEVKEKLNQEMQDMMHKNIEKFSPKKEPKPVTSASFTKHPDSSMKVSDRPRRINPFNHVDPTEIPDATILQMQPTGPPSSASLQDLSTYSDQPHPSFKSVNFSASEHSFVPHQMPHSRIPPNYNLPYSQNFSPYPQNYISSPFHLMPPFTRVRPSVENSSSFEDIDSIINEAKIRKNQGKLNQRLSDPWVKMQKLPDDSVSPNCGSTSVSSDYEYPPVHHKSVSPTASYSDSQDREVQSAAREHRQRDAPPTSIKEHQERSVAPPPASLVRPLIEAAGPCEPEDLIEGIIFTAHYLGSTQLQSERNPGKNARMMQAQEAVGRIKAPDGESQPSVEVDLFISTDKVKILNADTQETIMDHTLRSISYIADIGKLLVIMAKRRAPQSDTQDQNQIIRDPKPQRSYRVICHVFSSHDAQLMAQAIGQAFNVAYQQFLTANGIEPQTLTKDDYNQLLDMQEMYHDDLVHYSKRENIKDIWVEKNKGENLGVVIVESGWGSIVPTVILANLQHGGPAERCGKLSIGDQIMTVNGTSLVGLPLATCQSIIKGLKSQSIARLNIISCPPVVTVLIKRPDLKYQLGFSVQDGIICSLMRGGIAERGGVRVGHRIIEINNQSVVATPHERIVQTLVSSVGEIQMKTMPAMMYRLLTGQEQPIYI